MGLEAKTMNELGAYLTNHKVYKAKLGEGLADCLQIELLKRQLSNSHELKAAFAQFNASPEEARTGQALFDALERAHTDRKHSKGQTGKANVCYV